MRVKGKQINKLFSGYIRVSGSSVTGSSVDVTTDITSILTTAGYNGQPLLLTPSTGPNSGGVIVDVPYNRVEIFDNLGKEKIVDAGKEVYGRITELLGVYTLSFYFKDDSNIETVHTFGAATPIDFEFAYRFEFGELPTEIFIGLTSRNVVTDAGGAGDGTLYKEAITVTGLNTLASLTYLPISSTNPILFVNGKPEFAIGATPSFSTSGTTITWLPANAGYDLDPTDVVTAEYMTLQI